MKMQQNEPTRNHCMIVHAYYPIGETRVEREALALVDNGFSVDVICLRLRDQPLFEIVDGVNVYRLPVKRHLKKGFRAQMLEYLNFFTRVIFKLMRLYPRRRYQTVQAHNLPDFLIFSALLPKLAGARLILDIHDIMPEFMAARTGKAMNSLPVRLTILQEQLACRFANHVITVTDLWKERLIQRGVRANKVSVVMNLADERFFAPIPEDRRLPRENQRFTLIYHGAFKQRYGLDVLIHSIAIARKQAPDILLILQGVGEFIGEMNALVEELGLQENVKINNYAILVNKLPALIYQADMGVVPNHNDLFTGDLLPTKLLEYVALGMPVIAARTRVISSYFDENMLRFFTPGDEHNLADVILDAYNHRDKLPEQVRQMQQFNDRYNWIGMAKQYVALIVRLSDQVKTRRAVDSAVALKKDGPS